MPRSNGIQDSVIGWLERPAIKPNEPRVNSVTPGQSTAYGLAVDCWRIIRRSPETGSQSGPDQWFVQIGFANGFEPLPRSGFRPLVTILMNNPRIALGDKLVFDIFV